MLHILRDYARLYIPRRGKFVSIWKTDNAGTSNPDQITLPLQSNGIYNFWVDWGDGGIPENIKAWNDPKKTHTFPSAGTYTVSIWGRIEGWSFNNGGDKLKILSILSWGPLRLGPNRHYFYGCSNLTIPATDTLDLSGTNSLYHMFRDCSSIDTMPSLKNFDTSKIKSFRSLFMNCNNFIESVSNLDTSNAEDMYGLFANCYYFNNSVTNFNTSKVTDMGQFFANCGLFNQPITNFDTSQVTNMYGMFLGCTSFNQSLSHFNTSKVIYMEYMFYNASSFNQPLSNFDTSKVTSMKNMFYNAVSFNQDISNFNVEKVTTMEGMFSGVVLSTPNYNALLLSWASQNVLNNVLFHAGSSKYTPGGDVEAARTHLISEHGWTITDGGPA